MSREPSNPIWGAVRWTAVTVMLVGVVATAVRWVVDPSAPSTSCISGGGTVAEAVVCIAMDGAASVALWMAIVGTPVVLVTAGVAFALDRRRTG